MIVATAVSPANINLFRLNLELCEKWGGGEYLLLMCDPSIDRHDLAKAARRVFKTVRAEQVDDWKGVADYPTKENLIWQATARFIEEELSHRFDSWLWWEQDACPLQHNWISLIEEAHENSHHSFTGHMIRVKDQPSHMDRCGVWPSKISKYLKHSGALFVRTAPFDRVAAPDVIGDCFDSDCFLGAQKLVITKVREKYPKACLLRGMDGQLQELFLGRMDIRQSEEHFDQIDYPSFHEQTDWETGIFAFPYSDKTCYFNPGLLRRGDDLFLFTRRFRYGVTTVHGVNTSDKISDLAIWKIRNNMTLELPEIVPDPPHRYIDEQWEDPRVVVGDDGKIFVGFATWVRSQPWMIRQSLTELSDDWESFDVISEPDFGGNAANPEAASRHEKNWTWFRHEGRWLCVYAPAPHLVFSIDEKNKFERVWKGRTKLDWNYGEIRGGSTPVRINEYEYLSFFHSSLPWRGHRRRYYMGAYTFEATPPFSPRRMTTEPLLSGSDCDFRSFEGPLVVFPNGSVREDDGRHLVTFGVNDENCGWVKIPERDLLDKMLRL